MIDTCILLADNDPVFLSTCAEFLGSAGYRVLKAANPAKARQILETARIHLVILDLRLTNDDDQKDRSGLVLAKEMVRSVPKLILTKFPTHQDVREALKLDDAEALPLAVDFVDKREGLNELLTAVKQALSEHVHINWDLLIRWDERERLSFPHLVTLIEPDLDSARLSDRAIELEDLFRKLFYEKSQITIGRLLWHRGGRTCTTVFAYSLEGGSEQRIVTCGLRLQIEQEIARYKEFAPKGSTGSARAAFAETMHFATIAYVLPEADLEQVQTFEAFYQMSKVRQVREALRHLFQTTLAAWHQGERILEETKSLSQLYRQRLNLSQEAVRQEELQQSMEALAREALSLGPTSVELSAHEFLLRFPNGDIISYPNPIPHVYEEAEAVENGPPVVCRITPGTLSGDNILVDQDGRTWLTDFARAGPAPFLWDFVSLEAMIRFDLVQSADLQALHEFEKRLVAPTRLNERLDTQDIDPQFRKALGVIQEIRRQAFSASEADPTPYYRGLFFYAVSRMASYVPNLRYTRQELARPVHALLTATMICDRMMQIAYELSPEDSSPAARGIEIDEANRQVWVEGRQVALSPSEFDVLLYLYNHPGQLCTRRSIVEEGLQGKYIGNQQEASRINTTIGRLRKKIEPDPEHHRYILTVRGKGYRLCLGDKDRS
jgi:DNA-binding response OmpR family regulator